MGSRRDQRILEAKIRNIQYLLPVILSIFNLVTPWHNRTSLSTLRSTTSYAEGRHTHGQSLCLCSQERHRREAEASSGLSSLSSYLDHPRACATKPLSTGFGEVPIQKLELRKTKNCWTFRQITGMRSLGRSWCTQVEEVFFSNKLTG